MERLFAFERYPLGTGTAAGQPRCSYFLRDCPTAVPIGSGVSPPMSFRRNACKYTSFFLFSTLLYKIDANAQAFLFINRIFDLRFLFTCAFAGISSGGSRQ
ncbi:hypothetical protein ACFSR7_24345 [Cohnella sp. GCM10020058]|uniref:hypothetical protein n=1 Tax=Cohnella sp. GCM10020058 TaxID=3317330 RepID=UPI0036456B0D